ncbi:MAG: aminoglycoside 6-adenylyltransferase [Clostridiaceae bacterium]|nr:aminoglycoside 6-adenylyltransferase [Clostridiaceae bacterium]
MRSAQTMTALILGLAAERPEVRAVWLNGSRANPTAQKDALQDFDIVFAVTDTRPLLRERTWLTRFGEIAVMQEPDDSAIFPVDTKPEQRYAFLIQFADGCRIDLTLLSPPLWFTGYFDDRLTVLWLDKDGVFPPLPPPDDRAYYILPPTEKQFLSCCNEFWWTTPYVAKGLWRSELLYAMDLLNKAVRPMLLMMLSWRAGYLDGFARSVGKCFKYLPAMLPEDEAARLLRTYPSAEPQAIWNALITAADLMDALAPNVAAQAGFFYREDEAAGSRAYLEKLYAAGPGGTI